MPPPQETCKATLCSPTSNASTAVDESTAGFWQAVMPREKASGLSRAALSAFSRRETWSRGMATWVAYCSPLGERKREVEMRSASGPYGNPRSASI